MDKTDGMTQRPKIVRRFDNWLAQRVAWQPRFRGNYDVVALAHYQAAVQSAEFYTSNLANALEVDDHHAFLAHAMNLAKNDGLILEFGVASGRTITWIADQAVGIVHGFDSFEGLPEAWYGNYRRGTFARDHMPDVPHNVTLIEGWFSDTLPGFLAEHSEPVSFLHIDCDLYSSASYVLSELRDRIVPGTVIVFDEFFNYPGWRQHEYRAFMEFVESTGLSFRYDSFLRASQPVCVMID